MKDLKFVTKIMVYPLGKIPIFRPLKNHFFLSLKGVTICHGLIPLENTHFFDH